jgi:hypothetical protein
MILFFSKGRFRVSKAWYCNVAPGIGKVTSIILFYLMMVTVGYKTLFAFLFITPLSYFFGSLLQHSEEVIASTEAFVQIFFAATQSS